MTTTPRLPPDTLSRPDAVAANHHFDWNLVRSYLAVLEHGSLQAAARSLRKSQPTIGRHIEDLEKQWGVVLFERTARGLLPTAVALQLRATARSMEEGALQLARTLSGVQTQTAGTVRITASVPVANMILPGVLAGMRLALPDIQVELVASNAVSNLLRREADIAIRMVRPDQSTLVARKIGDVDLLVCAHARYLERCGVPATPPELLQHTLIGSDADTAIRDGFAAMGWPVGPEIFSLRCDDFMVQWQAVRAGLGIGFAASYMLRSDPQVVPVLAGQLNIPPLPMWLAVHREIHASKRIRAVFDYLAQALPTLL